MTALPDSDVERLCNVKRWAHVWECNECGALIADPFGHSLWHDSTRSQVVS